VTGFVRNGPKGGAKRGNARVQGAAKAGATARKPSNSWIAEKIVISLSLSLLRLSSVVRKYRLTEDDATPDGGTEEAEAGWKSSQEYRDARRNGAGVTACGFVFSSYAL